MRKLLTLTLFLATWLTCSPALAATATDFYAGLLQRGVADVQAGRFEDAITPLRLAAFGLVDTIELYETSLAYLAVALNNTGESVRAAEVLQRILAAERIERRFASLPLPASIRTQLDALTRTLLSSAEFAALAAPATGAPHPSAQPAQGSSSLPTGSKALAGADVSSRLAAADRALSASNLDEARRIYRDLLTAPNLDHAIWVRVAEGLYRSRDYPGVLAAFEKVTPLRPGEEAYRYYVAVALYETGQLARARQELAAALPYIELTPDVVQYRGKIEEPR